MPANATPKPSRPGRKRRAAGWTLLALGLLVAGVWVWSGCDRFSILRNNWFGVDSAVLGGRLTFDWTVDAGRPAHEVMEHRLRVTPAPRLTKWRRPGWFVEYAPYRFKTYDMFSHVDYEAEVALWPIPVLLWIPAAFLLRSGITARRRAVTGRCKSCGYNLAGLAADTPCPECGKAKTS